MMLPSGNDAAVTLAVEFGKWLYLMKNPNEVESAYLNPEKGI